MYHNILPHSADLAALVLRVVLGSFFLLARFRIIWDPSLHLDTPQGHHSVYVKDLKMTFDETSQWFPHWRWAHLRWKVSKCGYPAWLTPLVAVTELAGGFGVLMGFLTPIALLGLLVTLAFATLCTARGKIAEQCPVDLVDCVCCYFWRVEGIYIAMCLSLLMTGPGKLSLDYVWRLL